VRAVTCVCALCGMVCGMRYAVCGMRSEKCLCGPVCVSVACLCACVSAERMMAEHGEDVNVRQMCRSA